MASSDNSYCPSTEIELKLKFSAIKVDGSKIKILKKDQLKNR